MSMHRVDAPNTIIGVPFRAAKGLKDLCHDQLAGLAADDEAAVQEREFKIRLADQAGRRSSASMLINRRYAWRGYASDVHLDEDPNRVTLIAASGEMTIGTISINFDSEAGLLVDEIYKDRVDLLRQQGHKVCEFVKLAVDAGVRSKRVLGALFHIAMIFARNIHGSTHIVIEVNPRHVRFYEQMLDFQQLGEMRWNPRVNAPAVLLGIEFARTYHKVLAFGGREDLAATEKSFFPYFFSPHEELHITRRLLGEGNLPPAVS